MTTETKKVGKAPAARGGRKPHKKPVVPKEVTEAKKVAKQMYDALKAEGAPKATPSGYIMGACQVLKMLMTQAVEQGADKEGLKLFAHQFIHSI